MQYLYHAEAGLPSITLTGDEHRYIFKVRRHRQGEMMALRNLTDNQLYHYQISSLDKKEANLQLQSSEVLAVHAKRELHIGWCLIDPKNIEKVLPTLNELGVAKITFIYCDRSQKDFKLDFKRMEKILLNSSQQSGRSSLMILEQVDSLKAFLKVHPESYMLNFSETKLHSEEPVETVVIGCEGGFTQSEVVMFEPAKIIGLDTPLILKSESAACAVASKILL